MGLISRIREREVNSDLRSSECLFRAHCVDKELVSSLRHSLTLHGHEGCVNALSWNAAGTLLVSGSDDQRVMVWREDGRILSCLRTAHSNNIFSVLFIPNARDHLVVSAAGDSLVLLHDLEKAGVRGEAEGTHIQRWECVGRVKKLATCAAEPRLFWSASEDGVLKQYDLRDNRSVDLLNMAEQHQLKSLACNDARSEMIAVGISEAVVPIYDRRNMKEPVIRLLPAHLYFGGEGRFLATHLSFNRNGTELIVNIGSDNIYIFDVRYLNRHDSPDVLSTLQRSISNEQEAIPKCHERNGTVSAEQRWLEEQQTELGRLKDEQQFSKAIDKCSQILASRWESFMSHLPILFSTKFSNESVKQLLTQLCHPTALVQCLFMRACCFFERNWEGDKMDSIRDFLTILRIYPRHKTAHLMLIKCLISLEQIPLANECFSHFCNFYPSDERIEELRQLLASATPEVHFKKWTQEYSSKYRDYLNRYTGHLNINTDIKESNWFGADDQYIVAGSDCGSMFIWERKTQCVVRVFKGDHYTVNCCQPHPQRCLIASSGIDNVIRFWEPAATSLKSATEQDFPEEKEERDISDFYELMKRNRRTRTPELVWEQLLNSVGLGLFQVDSMQDDDDTLEERDEEGQEGTQIIRCRQM